MFSTEESRKRTVYVQRRLKKKGMYNEGRSKFMKQKKIVQETGNT